MDNKQYSAVEVQIEPRMKEVMEALRQHLMKAGFEATPVDNIDHDLERGYGFEVVIDAAQNERVYVDTVLTDGEVRGFEAMETGNAPAFGLLLQIMTSDAKVLHSFAPYNFSPLVGTNSVEELQARLLLFESQASAIALVLEVRRGELAKQPPAEPQVCGVEVPPSPLEYSLDGGQTYLPASSGVRLRFRQVDVPGEDSPGELHINASSEGLVTDLWVSRESALDHNLGTSSQQLGDIVGDLAEQSSLGDVARDRG
jgi:hypothetical protein